MIKRGPKLIVFIFLLALALRTVKLTDFPVGFHSDEARVAWNSLSVLKTGRDDHGKAFSLYYNTFGDYRPTGIFYATIPALLLFGRSEFAVRFFPAVTGALTVFLLYLLVLEMLKNEKLAVISSFLLAISPWHIEVSRATSEVVISSFFALSSVYFLIKLINDEKKRFAFWVCISMCASYFFYHAIRFLAPPFFLTVILFYFK